MKKISIFIVLSIFFISTLFSNAAVIPDSIRIGLYFSSTAKSSVALEVKGLDMNFDYKKENIGLDAFYSVSPVNADIYINQDNYVSYNQAFLDSKLKNLESGEEFFVVYSDNTFKIGSFNQNINFDSQVIRSNQRYICVNDNMKRTALIYNQESGLKFSSSDNSNIRIESKPYRGYAQFKVDANNKLTVINTLDIEDYLYGVVPKEMPSSWNKEALKAQAIAARNYTMKNIDKYKTLGFDLCTTQNSQVYGGYASEQKTTNQAVDETRGMLAYYQNNIAELFYHSSSGGKTESAENVWSKPVAYLKGVEDSYSLGSPNDNWTYKINKEEIEKILKSKNNDIGNLLNVTVDKKSENDRVLELTFTGTKSSVTYKKEAVRGLLGYSNIKSTYFDIDSNSSDIIQSKPLKKEYDLESIFEDLSAVLNNNEAKQGINFQDINNEYVFNGKGWGHGLGLSQYGAKNMADLGYSFDQILKYYFTGIEIY